MRCVDTVLVAASCQMLLMTPTGIVVSGNAFHRRLKEQPTSNYPSNAQGQEYTGHPENGDRKSCNTAGKCQG